MSEIRPPHLDPASPPDKGASSHGLRNKQKYLATAIAALAILIAIASVSYRLIRGPKASRDEADSNVSGVVGTDTSSATRANRDLATQFVKDLHSGNIAAAHAQAKASTQTGELKSHSTVLKANGPLSEVAIVTVSPDPQSGARESVTVVGRVTYASGKQSTFEMIQDKVAGEPKVIYFAVRQ